MWLFKIIILTFALNSCGLTPIYKKSSSASANNIGCKLANIDLNNNILNLESQAIYTPLYHILYDYCDNKNIPKEYKLNMRIEKTMKPVLFYKTGNTTRKNVLVTVAYDLIELKTYHKVYSSRVRNSMGFNTLDTPFTEYVSLQDGIENVGRQNAQDIVQQLIFFLENNPK